MEGQYLQERVVKGRGALPVALLLAAACWAAACVWQPGADAVPGSYPLWHAVAGALPPWALRAAGFLACGLAAYFLTGLNNACAFIRTRASVQSWMFMLLAAACPELHPLGAGNVGAAALVAATYFLTGSYHRRHAPVWVFHAFACLGAGSLALPQLTWLVPVFWAGAWQFMALGARGFCASLLGWALPYWFLLGHACLHGDMQLFCLPFRELATFTPWGGGLETWQWATGGYLVLLFAAGAAYSLRAGGEEKRRTRSQLAFVTWVTATVFAGIAVQPALYTRLLPLALAGTALQAGYLFVHTHGRRSNRLFIGAAIGLAAVFLSNLLLPTC